jgi:hypothetical protein
MSPFYFMHYRKIWENANGIIPKDKLGRPYEIHHIDGNRENNDLNNLICVSIEEHFRIRYEQKDYSSCNLIADRLGNSSFCGWNHSEEIKRKISEANKGKSPWNKGKTGVYTKDQLNRIRETTREKTKGVKKTKEHVEKVAAANKGKKRSEESRKKMSDAKKGKKTNTPSEEIKRKIANSQPRSKKIIHIKDGILFDTMKEAQKYYSVGYKVIVRLIKEGVFVILQK